MHKKQLTETLVLLSFSCVTLRIMMELGSGRTKANFASLEQTVIVLTLHHL